MKCRRAFEFSNRKGEKNEKEKGIGDCFGGVASGACGACAVGVRRRQGACRSYGA